MKVLPAQKFTFNVRIVLFISVLVISFWAKFTPNAAAAIPRPPGPLWMFELLFEEANTATGFPFSTLPGLNGSDKTKFVNDQLINRDELLHLTAFLEVQLYIAIQFMPDLVEFRRQEVNNCKFLLRAFQAIASATDAKGSKAISLGDIEQLYMSPGSEGTRDGAVFRSDSLKR